LSLGSRSTLTDVARVVGGALRDAGIEAALVGGACATIYSRGEYQSLDLDFILETGVTRRSLDAAMAAAGFRRSGDRYVHPKTKFFVEFPRGPLSIGRDAAVRTVMLRVGASRIRALSATDSCRDRLAAFYFWNDLPSLSAALAIARRQKVKLSAVKRWSRGEGHGELFEQFRRRLDVGG
jgi:hypothetical protein